jgi:hypothetical protein
MRIFLLAGIGLLLTATAFLDGPPVGFTGGFDEPTCYQCHFDGVLNPPEGTLLLEGVPDAYVPGQVYPITVHLAGPGLQRGGFELAARYSDGAQQGQQAGSLQATSELIAVDLDGAVQYLRHTKAGTLPAVPDTIQWAFVWQAPASGTEAVVFHVAANAANGDESQFGDQVFTLEAVSRGQ